MKKLTIILIVVLSGFRIIAQNLPVKLYEFIGATSSTASWDSKPGKELNNFQVPGDANSERMYIQIPVADYKKVDAKYLVRLMITTMDKGSEVNIHNKYWNPLYKDTTLVTECFFPAGDYTISLVDNNDAAKVYAKRSITVKPNGKAVASEVLNINGYPYDKSKFKLWTCKSVDDQNWKAIGPTSKIKAGTCISLFFESVEKIKNPGPMRWKIFKVGADGKETFVNQKDQTLSIAEFRKMYYEECDEFRTKGKYRIYLAVKNESEAYYGVLDKDYFVKADLEVE